MSFTAVEPNKQVYPDEKGEQEYDVHGADSDDAPSVNVITALVAEGEQSFEYHPKRGACGR